MPNRITTNSLDLLGPPRTIRLAYYQEDLVERIQRQHLGVSRSDIIRQLVGEGLKARQRRECESSSSPSA